MKYFTKSSLSGGDEGGFGLKECLTYVSTGENGDLIGDSRSQLPVLIQQAEDFLFVGRIDLKNDEAALKTDFEFVEATVTGADDGGLFGKVVEEREQSY